MRIVSLLPSATEILFALGVGDRVVGVTVECDHPPEARTRAIVSASELPGGLSPAQIDAAVTARMAAGEDLYRLDAGALAGLDADLVVTQDLCAVCAPRAADVDAALRHLGCDGRVVTLAPTDLDSVIDTFGVLGRAAGAEDRARDLQARTRTRLDDVEGRVAAARPVPVLVLEWPDPPYAPGHWIPEMASIAGGRPVLGTAGARSRRVSWETVAAAGAEVVVSAPCGMNTVAAAAATADLLERGVLPPAVPVWAVDADASYARPGPRLADGVETLAAILHPDRCGTPAPERAVRLR